ncbi:MULTISPECIES: glycosyltransferase [Pantoea]|uniref:glycosyltransferase n=1 Tax=Pantoea TaxID=53335 RepID=UPI00257FE526|nr:MULTISPECIES: glycosyltransferase [Pantoea]MDU5472095.1 glycosyltransferase [Pantoea sp.]
MNITALIVTYNRLHKLKKTLMATRRLPFNHIVIVNNASTDNTEDWLNAIADANITILHSKNNNGGAGGFRLGSEYISKYLETEWIVFFDDDAYPADDFISNFSSIDKNEKNVYCSEVRTPQGKICKMNLPWKKRAITLRDNLKYIRYPENYIAQPNLKERVLTFSFVGCIISKRVLVNSYKYIQPDLFIYYDDVFFSYNLTYYGYEIFFCPELKFIHDVKEKNSWDGQEWKIYYLSRNLFLYEKYFPGKDFFSTISKCIRIIKYTIDGLKCKHKKNYYAYLLKGIFHGMKNKGGRNH